MATPEYVIGRRTADQPQSPELVASTCLREFQRLTLAGAAANTVYDNKMMLARIPELFVSVLGFTASQLRKIPQGDPLGTNNLFRRIL
jgi:hypothetical protein